MSEEPVVVGKRLPRTGTRLAMNLPRKWRDPTKRYGLALVWAGFALFLRGALPFPQGAGIYQLPLVAVVLSAWYGGRGPGLLASLICVIGAAWLVPPVGSFHVSSEHALPFSIFIALCLLLAEFGASRRRAQQAQNESEERSRLMAETVPEILWIESIRPRRMLYMSPRYEQIWGRPLGDLERDPEVWMKAVHAEDRDEVRSAWQRWRRRRPPGCDVPDRSA
jgi:PAS domain-containing protein